MTPSAAARPHNPVREDDIVRFSSVSTSTTLDLRPMLRAWRTPSEYVEIALADTHQAVADLEWWFRRVRRSSEGTVRARTRDLTHFFELPISDPGYGGERPITLPELLRPGYGPLLIAGLIGAMEELGYPTSVIDRYLRAVRTLCDYVCKNHVLRSNVDLYKRYGVLTPPLAPREIRTPRRPPVGNLPTPRQLAAICEAAIEWALEATGFYRWHRLRNATVLILKFGSGMRTGECCRLDLGNQSPSLLSELAVDGEGRMRLMLPKSKNGDPREIMVEPFAVAQLDWWLRHERPRHAPVAAGMCFPGTDDPSRALQPGSLADGLEPLLDRLKELQLIDPRFTAHWTRKTWATHRLNEGRELPWMRRHGGWRSPESLAAYVGAPTDVSRRQRRAFAMAPGRQAGL